MALRLQLFAWWHKISPIVFQSKIEETPLREDIILYENLIHSMGPFLLKLEVMNVLKGLLETDSTAKRLADLKAKLHAVESRFVLTKRESQLKEAEIQGLKKQIETLEKPLSPTPPVDLSKGKTFSNLFAHCRFRFQEAFLPLKKSILLSYEEGRAETIFSLTMPGEEFLLQFLKNYEMAKQGSEEEKRCLKRQLALAFTDKDLFHQHAIGLLIGTLLAPEVAPSLDQMVSLFRLEEKEFVNGMSEYGKKIFPMIDERGSGIFIAEWISGKPAKALSNHEFVISGKKSPSVDPSRAELEEDFKELPHCDIESLASPLDIKELHEEIIDQIPLGQLEQDRHEEQESLNDVDRWLAGEIEKNAKQSVVKTQFERVKKGVIDYQKEIEATTLPSKTLSQDPLKIESALKKYQNEIDERELLLNQEEKEILAFANNLHNNQEIALEILREQRETFDIETLLIAFGRKDQSAIQNGNPTLSEEEIVQLTKQVGHYALLRSEHQQLLRCKKKLEDYLSLLRGCKNSTHDLETLYAASNDYFAESGAKRCYRPSDHPRVLIYEVLGDLLVREEQLSALLSFGSDQYKLLEARTGFGKSKVLLPLWLLLTAESQGLAIMTVHANLFDQQESYLQRVFKKAYRFYGVRIDFSRDSPASKEDIIEIEETLRRAEALRRPVFMSDQTAHSLFVLKIKEIAQNRSTSDDYAALEALLSLRRYVKERGFLFVDEPHKVLNDAEESNYSIGHPKGFGKERLQFGLNLYLLLFETIEGQYRLEFWSDPDLETQNLPLLTEEEYRMHVIPALLKKVVQKEGLQLSDEESRYLQGEISFQEQYLYEQKLAKMPDKEGRATKIRILHDQLFFYLPATLMQHCDENYALISSDRSAVPMESARNPKEGNEFVLIDQIFNFTIQANLNTPFSEAFIEDYLAKLGQEAAEELDKGADSVQETLAYKKFSLLFIGKPWCSLLKMRPCDLERLCLEINNNLVIRLQFIGLAVLPNLRRYEEKITSDPHLLSHCFKRISGASGTLAIQHLPYQFVVKADEKAMAKTLVALFRKYKQFQKEVIEFFGNKSHEITKDLFNKIPEASVILEVGAVMRDYPSLVSFAKDLLENAPEKFQGVATFDSNGVPIVLMRDHERFVDEKEANVASEQLIRFFGQKDTTGTDQKLPPLAEAILFINEKTTLTELIQGAGRMRSLLAKQQVTIALDQDSAFLIKKSLGKQQDEKLSLFDIFSYCIKNEGEQNGFANFYSLTKQWNALLENAFWDAALQAKEARIVAEDFQRFRSELVDSNFDQPLQNATLSTKSVEIEEALSVQKARFERKRAAMEQRAKTAHMRSHLLTRLQRGKINPTVEMIQHKMEYPNEMYVSENGEATQHAQATSEQMAQGVEEVIVDILGQELAETESETVTEATQLQFWTNWAQKLKGRRPLNHKEELIGAPLITIFSNSILKKFLPLFEKSDLLVSYNGACTFEGDTMEHSGWVTGYVKPLHYLVKKDGNWTLIDQVEAKAFLNKNQECEILWLVNHGLLIAQEGVSTQSFREDKEFCKRELIAKLLNGDLLFDEVQWSQFSSWITSPDEKRLCEQFIREILFNLHPLLENSPECNCLLKFLSITS